MLVSFRYDRCLSGNIFILYLNLGLEGPSHGKLCDAKGFQVVGGKDRFVAVVLHQNKLIGGFRRLGLESSRKKVPIDITNIHPVYTMYTMLVSGIYCKCLLGNCMESNIKQVHNPFLQYTN